MRMDIKRKEMVKFRENVKEKMKIRINQGIYK